MFTPVISQTGQPIGNTYDIIPGTDPEGNRDSSGHFTDYLRTHPEARIPQGSYRLASPIEVNGYNDMEGSGWGSIGNGGTVFYVESDMPCIVSSNADSEILPFLYLRNFMCQSTVTDNTSEYLIHVRNMFLSNFERLYTRSALGDLNYSATNVSGIHCEDTAPMTEGPYLNHFGGLFIQNGGLLLSTGNTDGEIVNSKIYGHCCAHALKFQGQGGNWTVNTVQVSSPPSSAGVWVDSGFNNHLRFTDIFFDGNPSVLTSGYGFLLEGPPRVQIKGGHVWGMNKAGIRAIDTYGLQVLGTGFLNCNKGDDSRADIEIVGDAFNPFVRVADTFHQRESAQINPGYAISEINDGTAVGHCIYSGIMVSPNYDEGGSRGAINLARADAEMSKVYGNSGGGTDDP